MTHKLIKTENYLLVVDESEIKESDWIYNKEREPSLLQCIGKGSLRGWKKIISHLPINAPILDGVPLLPPLEDEVEKLSKEWFDIEKYSSSLIADVNSFKEGYNKAKEKYKYTEEDLSKALSYGYHTAKDEAKGIPSSGYFTRFIQSLQQPKMPVGFECNMVDFEVDMGLGEECIEYNQYPKTTTNLQGLTQWVGKYVY